MIGLPSVFLVLAAIYLILSVILLVTIMSDANSDYRNGILFCSWIIGAIMAILSVVLYNSQFNNT